MDRRQKREKNVFSNENEYVWTEPKGAFFWDCHDQKETSRDRTTKLAHSLQENSGY